MRLVLDTNVFVSAVFFGGVPGQLLNLWRDGAVDLLLSSSILSEYAEVLKRLSQRYPETEPEPILSLAVRRGTFVQPETMSSDICADPDDDKFFLAAAAGACHLIISGDRHLLNASGWRGIEVVRPATFIRRFRSEHEHSPVRPGRRR